MKIVSEPFTRAELARVAGTSLREIELYRERGLLQPPRRRRGRSGDLAFHREHVERLRFIKRALSAGYALDDIARLADPAAASTCRDVYDTTIHGARSAMDREPARSAALRQIAERCPRKGTRAQCPIIRGLQDA